MASSVSGCGERDDARDGIGEEGGAVCEELGSVGCDDGSIGCEWDISTSWVA